MKTSAEKGYGRYAWIILFVFGLLCVIASPINLRGNPPNPPSPEDTTGLSLSEMEIRIPGIVNYIHSISRQLGNFLLAMGVFLMEIAAIPYRKGEKWAWVISWILPVNLMIQLINSRGGFGWQADLASLLIVLTGLSLPYRRFFPPQGGGMNEI